MDFPEIEFEPVLRTAHRLPFRVLLAEDDDGHALLMKAALPGNRYATTVCRNGAETIEALTNKKFDLLILDLMMPRFSGVDVLHYLEAAHLAIPIIVTSATMGLTSLRLPARDQILDFMVKPIDLASLRDRVSRIASQSRSRK